MALLGETKGTRNTTQSPGDKNWAEEPGMLTIRYSGTSYVLLLHTGQGFQDFKLTNSNIPPLDHNCLPNQLALFFIFMYWSHPWHVEVPGPEIKPSPQQ